MIRGKSAETIILDDPIQETPVLMSLRARRFLLGDEPDHSLTMPYECECGVWVYQMDGEEFRLDDFEFSRLHNACRVARLVAIRRRRHNA
jgi:hypothetical protein